MNYNQIYLSIVRRAQSEESIRKKQYANGCYFELHHILPKSLGGSNRKKNLARLTAREHFICHWLLVKIYPKDSDAYRKMVMALWRMQNNSRFMSSRLYCRIRAAYGKVIGHYTSISQRGHRNSQYGKHWFTNIYTGESISSDKKLEYPWYRGRYLFRGESSMLRINIDVIVETKQLWDKYHNGAYNKLEDMSNEIGISKVALYNRFKKYIPIFTNKNQKHRNHFKSNLKMVGVYN